METRVFASLLLLLFITPFWVILNPCSASASDIQCLKNLKESVTDPNGYLSSWNFNNKTAGFICNFNGIDCWHPDENKVLNIRLSDMGLQGPFPSALANCTSMIGLDLSNNDLTGALPSNISKMMQYVTTLHLSYNNFDGVIPADLPNCRYLNVIKLQKNRLTGQIPSELAGLERLNTFDVSDNLLSGPIPAFNNNFDASSYANNPGLCGSPLKSSCKGSGKRGNERVICGVIVDDAAIIGSAIGFFIFFVLSFYVGICCPCTCLSPRSRISAYIALF